MTVHKKGMIYVIYGRNKNDIIYVGSTTNLFNRYRGHSMLISKGYEPVYEYLRDNKLSVSMMIIEEYYNITVKELNNHEKYWIEQFRQWGFPIKNIRHNLSYGKEIGLGGINQIDSINNLKDIECFVDSQEYFGFMDILLKAQVSKTTMYRMLKAQKIKYVTIGMHKLYHLKDVINNKPRKK